jgi:hypothetical protein
MADLVATIQALLDEAKRARSQARSAWDMDRHHDATIRYLALQECLALAMEHRCED